MIHTDGQCNYREQLNSRCSGKMTEEIRVVDFSRASSVSLERNNEKDLREISKEIVECFENVGFVYVKNHGIPQEQINDTFKMLEDFFSLPLEVKRKYARKDLYSTGYVQSDRQILDVSKNTKELRETFDVIRNSGDKFPDEVKGFERSILQMIEMEIEFLNKFLRCLEIGLDLPFGTLLDLHKNVCSESNMSLFRLLYYPPVPNDIPENSVRCEEHTDYGIITLLFQDSMGGLEVKNRNNKWVQAHSVPGALLVNVAEMLQMLTSGRLIATPHRVLIPEEERKKRCSRKSIAFFLSADDEVVLKPFGTQNDDKKSYENSHDYMYSRLANSYVY